MNKAFLSDQAYLSFISLLPRERRLVSQALFQLEGNPNLGFKLWGRDDLYLYQTTTDSKIVYKLSGRQIHVVGIKAAEEHLRSSRAKISAIVLAAGKTSLSDTWPIDHVTKTLLTAGIDDLIVVLGYRFEQAKKNLRNKGVKIIINHDYEHGLSKSLRYGLKMVSPDTVAIVLTLGSLPLIRPEVVDKLLKTYREVRPPIVVPTYSHMRGHPVIFDTVLIPELLRARGNVGGRGVLRHHSRELMQIEVEDAGILKRIEN